jgi:hypothetical protein
MCSNRRFLNLAWGKVTDPRTLDPPDFVQLTLGPIDRLGQSVSQPSGEGLAPIRAATVIFRSQRLVISI